MKLFFLLLLVLFTYSCNTPESNLFEVDPRNFEDNKITLAEIADDISYIPLDNSLPIGITYKSRITHDYIYLAIKDVGIVQFDRYGKLIRKIGSKGRGPGEYYYEHEFTVDERTGNVFVLDRGKAKVYSQNGIFLRDISYNRYIGGYEMAGDIEIFNSLLFFPDYLSTGDSKYNWVILDTLGNLVAKKDNSIPPFQTNAVRQGSIYCFENRLFYFNYFNDTIFSISPDLTSQGEYLFAQGEHRWPRGKIDFVASIPQTQSWLYTMFQPETMFETKHFIVLIYSYLEKGAIALIDKRTKKTFLAYKYYQTIEDRTYSRPCLENDLDGGMPLSKPIKYYAINDKEYITTLITPYELKVHISSDEFKNAIPKYPEKKKDLEKLANNLKETDNPVLLLVRLKE